MKGRGVEKRSERRSPVKGKREGEKRRGERSDKKMREEGWREIKKRDKKRGEAVRPG